MKARFLRYGAIVMATAGMGLGIAAAGTASIQTTGPDSRNDINATSDVDVDAKNNNNVSVFNGCEGGQNAPGLLRVIPRDPACQDATSGDALVERNTEGGDAESGDAENSSDDSTDVAISNSGLCDCLLGLGGGNHDWEATIDTTGPNSVNRINLSNDVDIDVDNDNDVDVTNVVDQDATSGDATVRRNTSGGSATTGSASNSSSLTTFVSISN
jgi:hypothetical protein